MPFCIWILRDEMFLFSFLSRRRRKLVKFYMCYFYYVLTHYIYYQYCKFYLNGHLLTRY